MMRFRPASLLVIFIFIGLLCQAQESFVAQSIGKSYDVRRIDFTNFTSETLPSQEVNYAFKFSDFNTNILTSEGVIISNSVEQDSNPDTFFVLTDYDFETTLLDKIADKSGLSNLALAMFSSAYDFSFKDLAEPEFCMCILLFIKKLKN